MKRVAVIVLSALAVGPGTLAQSNPEVEKALLAAPRSAREGAAVIKWRRTTPTTR